MNISIICFGIVFLALSLCFSVHADDPNCTPPISTRVDGCSGPVPFQEIFTDACNKHDICYSTPAPDKNNRVAHKNSCDDAFLNNMKRGCYNAYTSTLDPRRYDCLGAALNVYQAVSQFGGASFAGGQKWADEHCQ
jgi:hypothetical protein